MKKCIWRIAAAVPILVFLGFIGITVNSFTGNPVSAYIASCKIKEYAAVVYPSLDLELSKVSYNFKNSAYGCNAASKKSEDTTFYIGYSHGKVFDEYEYEVANHFTTYRRLSKDFDDIVTNVIENEYPHETTMVIGDLVGDTQLLIPDKPLNLNDMPLKLSLTVSVLSDVRSEQQMAALLLELHQLMLRKGIPISRYSLELEEPIPEEGKPGSGHNLYLEDFPADRILNQTGNLASIIAEHQAALNKNDKK